MSKIIIHNRANVTDNHALECACMVLDETINKLENVEDYRAVEFCGLVVKGEIIKRKTCYTIVIS